MAVVPLGGGGEVIVINSSPSGAHPQVFFTAYADNVFMSCPLSLVMLAYPDHCHAMQQTGLQNNASESELYAGLFLCRPYSLYTRPCKSWKAPSAPSTVRSLIPCQMVTLFPSPAMALRFSAVPWVPQSAVGRTFARSLPTSAFPALHQRTKLALYCSNVRISYLLRALSLDLSLSLMPSLDTLFDHFMATTLHFEPHLTGLQLLVNMPRL